ncbi:MAG: SurA N-terminal domain-containing protein [Rhodospirillales bacterium]
MLEAIRKRSASFVVKGLFVLLVLSFGLWGIADVYSPSRGDDWAATVGDRQITAAEVSDEYRRELRRLGITLGTIDPEQARALGLSRHVLDRMIDRTLLDVAAADLGITVGDALVRQTIQADPLFRGQFGTFDADLFRRILDINGMTEEQFVARVRGDIGRNQLIASVAAGSTVPPAMAEALYRHRAEQRVAEVLQVSLAAIDDVGAPGESELRQFYEDTKARFTAPEYRALTAVVVSARQLQREIAVSERELQDEFRGRIDDFSRPESRAIRQMVFGDEEAAVRAHARLAGGAAFTRVAEEEAGLEADALEIGTVTRDRLPTELAEVAFALPPGAVSEPVQSALGWHLLEVTAIEPARQATLDDVRAELTAEIAGERALDALHRLTMRLEDELGGGATLEEAAARLDLDLRRIAAVDPQGLDPDGRPLDDLPPGLVDTAFATAERFESALLEAGDDTYFVVRVDAVTPAAARPFDAIRTDVLEAWRADQRQQRGRQVAETIAARLNDGADPAAVAAETGARLSTTPPFTRFGEGFPETLDGALVAAVFRAAPGRSVVVPGAADWYVARPKTIVAGEPLTDAAGLDRVRADLERALGVDLLSQLTHGLRRQHPIRVNTRALDDLM